MTLEQTLRQINPDTARAFVSAARNIIDALLIEARRIQQVQTPAPRDYTAGGLPRTAPAGGWIADDELRAATQQMSEALALEKWTEGVLAALRALNLIGAL